MWGWIFSGSNPLFCTPPLGAETAVQQCKWRGMWQEAGWTWKESTLWPPDYECSTLTCWQPIKMLFENIYQSVCWDFSLKFMKMIKSITCVLFQGLCFYSYGLYLSDETLWDGIKSWDSELCTSSGQDKVLGGGAIELRLTHTQGTHRWRWPHTDLSGGRGTGEPSHDRRSVFYFPNYRHRPSLSPRKRVVFLHYRLTHIHLDFVLTRMQF